MREKEEPLMNPIKILVVDDEPDLEFLISKKWKQRIQSLKELS